MPNSLTAPIDFIKVAGDIFNEYELLRPLNGNDLLKIYHSLHLIIAAIPGGGGLPPDGVYGGITVTSSGANWRLTDGVYGNITVSGAGTVWSITSGAVQSITAGNNIFVTGIDPLNPTINSVPNLQAGTNIRIDPADQYSPIIATGINEVEFVDLAQGGTTLDISAVADTYKVIRVTPENPGDFYDTITGGITNKLYKFSCVGGSMMQILGIGSVVLLNQYAPTLNLIGPNDTSTFRFDAYATGKTIQTSAELY